MLSRYYRAGAQLHLSPALSAPRSEGVLKFGKLVTYRHQRHDPPDL